MRVRIIRTPAPGDVDGLRLDRFQPGREYEVGPTLGSLLLAEGCAQPVTEQGAAKSGRKAPNAPPKRAATSDPPNLIRERDPLDVWAAIEPDAGRRRS
jgi:hypothetical protein